MGKSKLKQKTGKSALAKLILQENKYFVWGMIAAFLICVFSVTTYKIEDDDFFWHLSTGRFIVENGYVPNTDVFGYATQNAEWIPFEWGWDVISYSLYKIGGYNALFIFRSIIFCLIFFIYFRLLNKLKVNSVISVILFFTLLIAFFNRLSPRPHIFTYLFLSVLLYLLLCYRYIDRKKYSKHLYWLPVIFLIWGNLHLGVLTGILFLFVFIISEAIIYYRHQRVSNNEVTPITYAQLKNLIIIFVCSLLVLLINPHGLRTYTYAYSHTKMKMLESIAEWLSPFSSQVESGIVITLYTVLLIVGLIVLLYSFKKRDLTFALIYLVFAVYSLRAIRFTVDYEIIILPFLAVSLNFYLKQFEKYGSFILKFIYGNALKVLLITAFIFLAFQFQKDSFYISLEYNREAAFGISSRFFPVEMLKFIKDNNIKGTPFNNFDTGGYLKWEVPDQKIFIDSRNINDEIFFEYMSILNMQGDFSRKLDKYGTDYAYLFDSKLIRFPNILKQSVTAHFFSDTNWALVYWDDESMLFLKNVPKNSELISKYGYKVFNPFTAMFNRPQFEKDIRDFPAIAKTEIERKAGAEPRGYFFQGMNDIAQKILQNKNR